MPTASSPGAINFHAGFISSGKVGYTLCGKGKRSQTSETFATVDYLLVNPEWAEQKYKSMDEPIPGDLYHIVIPNFVRQLRNDNKFFTVKMQTSLDLFGIDIVSLESSTFMDAFSEQDCAYCFFRVSASTSVGYGTGFFVWLPPGAPAEQKEKFLSSVEMVTGHVKLDEKKEPVETREQLQNIYQNFKCL